MTNEFGKLHPTVNIIFYICVIGITIFQMQIGFIIISFIGALCLFLWLKGIRGLKYLLGIIVVFFLSAIMNPLFSHKGSTLLFYLFNGNPVTYESVVYGAMAALIICAMLLWFATFNHIITTDKLLAVVGYKMPKLSMMISMIFRFIPKYRKHSREVAEAYKALGHKDKRLQEKIKTSMEVFSATTTWALENSIDTADSMKARGYGKKKRTNYNNYIFEARDVVILIVMSVCVAAVICFMSTGKVSTFYYPIIRIKGNYLAYFMWAIFCFSPVIINIVEEWKWRRLKSKI